MSFNRIMSNGVMGMTVQTHALGTISDNIANARTVGYKRTETQFQDFTVNDRFGRFMDGAGVKTTDRLRTDQTNGLEQTGQTTNAAILGNGFFMVQDISAATGDDTKTSKALTAANHEPELTRAGDFSPDKYGHFVNSSGRALLGEKLTPNGTASSTTPTLSSLELVSISDISAYVEGTTRIDVSGNLPATTVDYEAAPEDGVSVTVGAVDNAGKRATVGMSYKRLDLAADGTATWQVSTTGATYDDGTAVPGSSASVLCTLTFGPNGELSGGDLGTEKTASLSVGSGFNPITLSFGEVGSYTGLRSTPGKGMSGMGYLQNGISKDSLKSVSLTDDGFVNGTFGEGQVRNFYRIPNAIVTNTNDLENRNGTAFQATEDSGDIKLKFFGLAKKTRDPADKTAADTTGTTLDVGAVEQSGTKIETEFTNLILAQRTYSASSKIISTADEMIQTANGMKS